ncbi:hypothetical protein ACQKII_07300 [Lysinibacillus sp. NPDC048646]|uniref:hypothetical protein n=1 Tax=Lysinibacillus sp. NPDC048646 TaxID=3390574 RepID=UPI003D0460D0
MDILIWALIYLTLFGLFILTVLKVDIISKKTAANLIKLNILVTALYLIYILLKFLLY